MKIYSIYDKEFKEYGDVIEENFSELLMELAKTPCPNEGTIYVASDPKLENLAIYSLIENKYFGGIPVQIGYCNGNNKYLNCVEYHKSSEINVMESDTILLLGKRSQIENCKYETKNIMAFKVPAGKAVEMYATTLHYAPCKAEGGFRVIVILPKGTNCEKPASVEDPILWASNKWLLCHPNSVEARQGAVVGLIGENVKVNSL